MERRDAHDPRRPDTWTAGPGSVVWWVLVIAACLGARSALAQWDPERQISAAPGDVWAYGIAASGTTAHLIWGISPVYYRRSTDEGATWSADTVISADGEPHLTDPVQADGANVYVVYLRNITIVTDWCCPRQIGDIYLRRSTNGGLTWLPESRLTTAGGAYRISLFTSGPRLDMAWMDFRRPDIVSEIYYRRSLDGGASWQPEVLLAAAAAGSVGLGRPQVSARGASVHVVWGDDRDANPPCYTVPVCPETYFKRSADGGTSWGPDVRLTTGGNRFAGRPEVAAASPSAVVVNYNQDVVAGDGGRMYVVRSTDDGATWGTEVRLTDSPSDHGAMVGSGASVHLAWHDRRDSTNTEIYYLTSLDGGATWAAEERVTEAAGESVAPLPAVSGAYLHLVWGDDRTGSLQVWYRRRALGAVGAPLTPAVASGLRLTVSPNPMRDRCVLEVEGLTDRRANVTIHDAGGGLVKRIVDPAPAICAGRFEWDGRDIGGAPVPAGVYFARVHSARVAAGARVVLVR
ncbi:MAG: FlgD immunoglobulin-like domain containing protein [Candidatus Eiseniibacteriota bacterium]